MRDYAELVKALRCCAADGDGDCDTCPYSTDAKACSYERMMNTAADAIEELLRIGAKMHTWIFLNTADEQAAYDEIGLTDEQNALFGYSGQIILKAEPPKERSEDS